MFGYGNGNGNGKNSMLDNVTSLTGKGLRDWLIQRVTAVVLGGYTVFLLTYIMLHPVMDYYQWLSLFRHPLMQIATVLVLLGMILHAWVGVWTITTDYLKCTVLRVSAQMVVLLMLLACFIWGIEILWGI